MNQKTMFILLGGLIVSGIAITILTFHLLSGEEESGTTITKQHEITSENNNLPPNVTEKEPATDSESEDTSDLPLELVLNTPEKTNTETISSSDAKGYETNARIHFRKFEFNEGISVLQEAVEKYSEEGDGANLHILNFDGTMLSNLSHSHGEEETSGEGSTHDLTAIKTLLSNVRDPEMALLGMLSLSLDDRNQLLPTVESLNPVFEGAVNVQSVSVEPMEAVEKFANQYEGIIAVYRINFMVENQELYGTVLRFGDGYSRLYSINEVKEGSTDFLTVREWSEILG